MPGDYVFERTWWMFAAQQGISAGLFLAMLGFCSYIYRRKMAELGAQPGSPAISRRATRQMRLLCAIFALPIPGMISWDATSQYFARFDHDGIHLPSAIGHGAKPWSEVRGVFLAPSKGKSTLCIEIDGGFIHFDSSVFAHPEQVERTLQAEVERHKARAEQTPPVLHPAWPQNNPRSS